MSHLTKRVPRGRDMTVWQTFLIFVTRLAFYTYYYISSETIFSLEILVLSRIIINFAADIEMTPYYIYKELSNYI